MQIADEIFDLDGEVHAKLLGQHPCAVTEMLLAVSGGNLVIVQASLLIFADLKDGFATMLQITNAGGQLLLVGKGGATHFLGSISSGDHRFLLRLARLATLLSICH
jgi:hypothetical protein